MSRERNDFRSDVPIHKAMANRRIAQGPSEQASRLSVRIVDIPACNSNAQLIRTNPAQVSRYWQHVTCGGCLRTLKNRSKGGEQ